MQYGCLIVLHIYFKQGFHWYAVFTLRETEISTICWPCYFMLTVDFPVIFIPF